MEVKRVETQDILNKLDSMTCLTEQIQAYNLLQEDYIDYIKKPPGFGGRCLSE